MGANDFLDQTARLAVECGDLKRQVATQAAELAERSNDHKLIEQKLGRNDFLLLDGTVGDVSVAFHFDREEDGLRYSGVWVRGEYLTGEDLGHAYELGAERALAAWERAEREANEDARRAA